VTTKTTARSEVAIVGCGGVSHSHGEALTRAHDVAQLTAACDVDPERAESYAAEYGHSDTAWYVDYEEMLRDVHPDIVILATWPNQHEEQVLTCVTAGVSGILCEKSLSTTGDSAARMARAAKETDIELLEGFMYRHNPRMRRFFELFEEGAIGDLRKIRAGFTSTVTNEENWRRDPERGGGVIFDYTCYCINAITAAAGDVPERVAAEWDRREDGLIESLYATIRFSDTLVAQVETSQNASFGRPLELHGNEATMRINPAWGGERNEIVRVSSRVHCHNRS